jgi:hypothetical protein
MAAFASSFAIDHAALVQLPLKDQWCFARALLAPPKPNAALIRAFVRRRELLHLDESSSSGGPEPWRRRP